MDPIESTRCSSATVVVVELVGSFANMTSSPSDVTLPRGSCNDDVTLSPEVLGMTMGRLIGCCSVMTSALGATPIMIRVVLNVDLAGMLETSSSSTCSDGTSLPRETPETMESRESVDVSLGLVRSESRLLSSQ